MPTALKAYLDWQRGLASECGRSESTLARTLAGLNVWIIIGNEAADLDSIVSATVLGYALQARYGLEEVLGNNSRGMTLKAQPKMNELVGNGGRLERKHTGEQLLTVFSLINAPRSKYSKDHLYSKTMSLCSVDIDFFHDFLFVDDPFAKLLFKLIKNKPVKASVLPTAVSISPNVDTLTSTVAASLPNDAPYPSFELAFENLEPIKSLSFVLIDHNTIDYKFSFLWENGLVAGVIDHHMEAQRKEKEASASWQRLNNLQKINFSNVLKKNYVVIGEDQSAIASTVTQIWAEIKEIEAIQGDLTALRMLLLVLWLDAKAFDPALEYRRWSSQDKATLADLMILLHMSQSDFDNLVKEQQRLGKEWSQKAITLSCSILAEDDLKVFAYKARPGDGIEPVNCLVPFSSLPVGISDLSQLRSREEFEVAVEELASRASADLVLFVCADRIPISREKCRVLTMCRRTVPTSALNQADVVEAAVHILLSKMPKFDLPPEFKCSRGNWVIQCFQLPSHVRRKNIEAGLRQILELGRRDSLSI